MPLIWSLATIRHGQIYNWLELSWIKLSWRELGWMKLSWTELSWTELKWIDFTQTAWSGAVFLLLCGIWSHPQQTGSWIWTQISNGIRMDWVVGSVLRWMICYLIMGVRWRVNGRQTSCRPVMMTFWGLTDQQEMSWNAINECTYGHGGIKWLDPSGSWEEMHCNGRWIASGFRQQLETDCCWRWWIGDGWQATIQSKEWWSLDKDRDFTGMEYQRCMIRDGC